MRVSDEEIEIFNHVNSQRLADFKKLLHDLDHSTLEKIVLSYFIEIQILKERDEKTN